MTPLEIGSDLEEFRQRIRAILDTRLTRGAHHNDLAYYGAGDSDDTVDVGRAVMASLAEGGWSTPTWPIEYGGAGLSPLQASVFAEELERFQTPGLYAFNVALNLVGPILLEFGTKEQKAEWLPGIRTGEDIWCQLFSEPDAGSDLASLSARAVPVEGGWAITGQKVWSSRAHYATWGLLLARTDPESTRHRGITAFVVDMRSTGIDVRPLRQINGDAHFNEVFLDEVIVPLDRVVGTVDDGWKVAMATLSSERASTGGGGAPFGGTPTVIRLLEDPIIRDNPIYRQRAASIICDMQVYQWAGLRVRAARLQGGRPGPEGSGGKLRLGRIARALALLSVDTGGLGALEEGSDSERLFLTAPSLSIRGGTDEIQHNIIGERVLGLPKEPR
jgi:alkylation response protein AidB-like acyl-CoA dehydrogenase